MLWYFLLWKCFLFAKDACLNSSVVPLSYRKMHIAMDRKVVSVD